MPNKPKNTKTRKEITSDELRKFLKDKRVTLECGNKFCIHPFSNTMIIYSDGKTACHSWGY